MGSVTFLYAGAVADKYWTVPVGVPKITVQAWGPGGNSTTGSGTQGGSGGGAYSAIVDYPVSAGDVYYAWAGKYGSDTYVSEDTEEGTKIVLAKTGGQTNGTTGAAGGDAASGIGDIKYSGGTGGNGVYEGSAGGGGGSAGSGGDGGNGGNGGAYGGTAGSAGAASSPLLGGAKGGPGCDSSNDPVDADQPGGGCGGASAGKYALPGDGKIIISWEDPVNVATFISNA